MEKIKKIAQKFDSIIEQTRPERIQIWLGANKYAEFMEVNGKTYAELVLFKGFFGPDDVTKMNGISISEFSKRLKSFLEK